MPGQKRPAKNPAKYACEAMNRHSVPRSPDVVKLDGPFEHQYVHTRGVRLHAAVAGPKNGHLVVLLHGAFGGWFEFRRVISPLAERGYRVAAVDLRGYGMSDKPPTPPQFGIGTLRSDIAGLIPALGYDDASLVGVGVGAATAWTVAASHPDRVRTLVSVAGAHPADLRRAMQTKPWDFTRLLGETVLRGPYRHLSPTSPQVHAIYRNQLQRDTALSFLKSRAFEEEFLLRVHHGEVGGVWPATVRTSRLLSASVSPKKAETLIDADVLFIHAGQSLWNPVVARTKRRLANDTTLTPFTIPGTKNMPHLEAPQAFSDVVATYLSQRV